MTAEQATPASLVAEPEATTTTSTATAPKKAGAAAAAAATATAPVMAATAKFNTSGPTLLPTDTLGRRALSTGLGNTGNRTSTQKEMAAEKASELIKGFAPHDTVCFTDGACLKNPGPCGAGAYVKFPDGEVKQSAALGSGTNNIGELYAIGMAMDLILEARAQGKQLHHEAKVHVLTDSNYAKGMLALEYKAKTNQQLIEAVKGKIAKVCRNNPVFIHWVAGHSKISGNELADKLAMQGALNSKDGVQIIHPLAQRPQPPTPTSVQLQQQPVTTTAPAAFALATSEPATSEPVTSEPPSSQPAAATAKENAATQAPKQVMAILDTRIKNMRREYKVRLAGQRNEVWMLESDLKKEWKHKIEEYNKSIAKATPSSSSVSGSGETKSTSSTNSAPTTTSYVPAAPVSGVFGELPPFNPMSTPIFKVGTREAADYIKDVDQAYRTVTKWRKNVFKLPSGSCGKHFVQTLSHLFAAYGERSPMECIALKAASILTPLLLQKPMGKLTYRDNTEHLTRRLQLWDEGNIKELLREGATIQAQLKASHKEPDDATLAKRFAAMVFNNNLKGAMSLVADKSKGGVLPINEDTKKEMKAKHPRAEPMSQQALLTGEIPENVHHVFYSELNGELVKKCALRTKGSAGVSQQEDVLWHKMVTGYKDSSSSLCNAVAVLTRRLATECVDPAGLEALLANRGIAIKKCLGLRPVGVGEMVRRIIGKAVMSVTGEKVQEAVGALQLCGGQPAGVESAIHAMRSFLDDDQSDGILLIDADNAFNRVNRATALWNVQFTCPVMKHILINFYRSPSRIFMNGEGGSCELLSQEGTTQGCPLAMAMYAIALSPLLKHLQPMCKQVWYADDATGCDKLEKMRAWFDELQLVGPQYGYFPKPAKCILVVKPHMLEHAQKVFKGSGGVLIQTEGSKDTGVEVTSEGTRHLGAAVGHTDFRHGYIKEKVKQWVKIVHKLAEVAVTQPHAAFAAFTHCLQGQWTFLSRTMPDCAEHFQPLEDVIQQDFIHALFKRQVTEPERDMLSLPARMGGMGIFKPVQECKISSTNSQFISAPLVKLISRQEYDFRPRELAEEMKGLRAQVDKASEERFKEIRDTILKHASEELKTAVKAASEKGGSSWVTACPSYEHGTVLHKRDFVDACCIRYGWQILNLPTKCVCDAAFNVQHALDCKRGGLRIIQHNEVRDTIAQCMIEAGHIAVEIEPLLQPLEGETFEYKTANKDDEARSDIKCCGFWGKLQQAYFDIKVVSPFARSNVDLEPAQMFKNAERTKIREYGERIKNVERGDFHPLVFTCTGGMAPASHMVMKRLAEKLSEKQNLPVSVVSGWLRCRLSFALLRTTILCVRATRSKKLHVENNIELAVVAARMDL